MFSGDSNGLILQWHCEITGKKKMSTGEINYFLNGKSFLKSFLYVSMCLFEYLKSFRKNS